MLRLGRSSLKDAICCSWPKATHEAKVQNLQRRASRAEGRKWQLGGGGERERAKTLLLTMPGLCGHT